MFRATSVWLSLKHLNASRDSPGPVHLRSALHLDGDASEGRSQPVLLMHSGTEFALAVFTGGGGRHVRFGMRRSVRTLEQRLILTHHRQRLLQDKHTHEHLKSHQLSSFRRFVCVSEL